MLPEWWGCSECCQNGGGVMDVARMVGMWWMLLDCWECDGCCQKGGDVMDVARMLGMWWMLPEWWGCDGCCQNVGNVVDVAWMVGMWWMLVFFFLQWYSACFRTEGIFCFSPLFSFPAFFTCFHSVEETRKPFFFKSVKVFIALCQSVFWFVQLHVLIC